tara:strand:+ start:21 stop:419 length:399 start_codon:yes stop_codon:yes gene_type:complete
MATNAQWTVVFEDRCIIKNYAEGADKGIGYIIDDNTFWTQSQFANIWAIQYGTSNASDEVEYRDNTPHSEYDSAAIGDIGQFTSRWDAAHLVQLQTDWDNNNSGTGEGDDFVPETEAEKIERLGPRPTSYTS